MIGESQRRRVMKTEPPEVNTGQRTIAAIPYERNQNTVLFTANCPRYALLTLYSLSLEVSTGERPCVSVLDRHMNAVKDTNQMFEN